MPFLSQKIGIDLGTANTLVFVPGKGVVLNEPSVVAVSRADNEILAVGNDAKEMVGKTPDDITVYRPLRDGVIADYRVTEAMLTYYIDKALRVWEILKPEVLVSVPAGVTSTERRAVVEAAVRAGAKEAHLIKEPVLAAIGAGIPIHNPEGNMVVDIGGGTTDIAVISLGGVVASRSTPCAGNSIDVAIMNYLKREHNLSVGDRNAERIKTEVGAATVVDTQKQISVRGRSIVEGLPKTLEITTNSVARAIADETQDIIDTIIEVLKETPPELSSDIIEKSILLTGGGAQLHRLPALVQQKVNVETKRADDPSLCVAKGTGVALDHLDTYKKSIIAKR